MVPELLDHLSPLPHTTQVIYFLNNLQQLLEAGLGKRKSHIDNTKGHVKQQQRVPAAVEYKSYPLQKRQRDRMSGPLCIYKNSGSAEEAITDRHLHVRYCGEKGSSRFSPVEN